MKFIIDFLEKEKQKDYVITKDFPNGIKFFYVSEAKYRVLHKCYKPLNDLQIDKLQADVNSAQHAAYVFPEWYKEFFRTTNGLDLFYSSIFFHGEQTPLVHHPKYGLIEALIERDNPEWMAPNNLRYSRNSIKDDPNAQARWLAIGEYRSDGTQIVWDFATQKIVIMYALPVTMSIRALKKMKESDYEQLILAEWDDFETFFLSETQRLSERFEGCLDITNVKYDDLDFWKKTLPKGHRDYVE